MRVKSLKAERVSGRAGEKELKTPTPSLRDTPPQDGNCLKILSLFDFLFPLGRGVGVGYIFIVIWYHQVAKWSTFDREEIDKNFPSMKVGMLF